MSGWIQTYTGRKFYPLNPDPKDIVIMDIAHALSNMPRFTGHTRGFYSVASHSVAVAEAVPPQDAIWALLHDASEAYLCDIARPVKHHPDFAFYRTAEKQLMEAVCKRFSMDLKQPASVTEADNRMLWTEKRDLMPAMLDEEWASGAAVMPPYTHKVRPVSPDIAKLDFILMARELGIWEE